MGSSALPLLLDNDKPRSHDRTLGTAAASTGSSRWRRACGRRWSGTALRLEQVRVVRLRINSDRLCSGKRIDGGYYGVLIGRILMGDGDVALAAIRNVDQFFRWIPSQSVNTRPVLDGRHDFTRVRINNNRRIVATGENAVGRLVKSDACRSFARIERPRCRRLPRFDVDHLDRVLAFVVNEDVSLSICRSAFRRVVFELRGTDDVAGLRIDRRQGSYRTAVIREN